MNRILTASVGFLVFYSGISTPALAELESPHCTGAMTYEKVLACSESRSPEVRLALAEAKRAKTEIGIASQRINPELSMVSVFGGAEFEADVELGFPIELGGKRHARQRLAETQVSQSKAILAETRVRVRVETQLKMHRLRQIFHEQEVLDDVIGTLTKLMAQYGRRPLLSPEQQLSQTIFRISKSEFEMKRADVDEELHELGAFFRTVAGREIEELREAMPASPTAWPEPQSVYEFGSSPQSRKSLAELESSRANLALMESEAWPTLSLGPAMQIQGRYGRPSAMFGLSLSVPLPVFHTNAAGKAVAADSLSIAESRKGTLQFEEKKGREVLLQRYEESKRLLAETMSHKELENMHEKMEALFLRGLVPSSLVIDAHRSYVELELMRNQREMKALEALLSIYIIDGIALEASL